VLPTADCRRSPLLLYCVHAAAAAAAAALLLALLLLLICQVKPSGPNVLFVSRRGWMHPKQKTLGEAVAPLPFRTCVIYCM
jgi:hypothetical protein